ncbi:DUF4337 domain-containing protein [Novosphingobium sp.]|uniref:DUF4337 domain-containing protein n=1 Tax=Novosphingobium sp. TaxID=1874826 RepID=UPI003341EA0D
MELEVSAEAKDKRLNRQIAITVVTLSVFIGLCHIKDENTVQGMDRSESHAIDSWNEYQASRTKLHIAEGTRTQLSLLGQPGKVDAAVAGLDGDIARYKAEAPKLSAKARDHEGEYSHLRFRHEQFNAADAAIATAISLAAVSALMEMVAVLWVAWGFAAFGVFMGLSAFLGGSFLPAMLTTLLG